MGIIGKFIANRRRKSFEQRIEREIFHKIFPHLRQEADHGYPFSSDERLVKAHLKGFYNASKAIEEINRAAIKMPRAEGDAFRFIAARDLNERLAMYLEFARDHEYNPTPEDCQLAARQAC